MLIDSHVNLHHPAFAEDGPAVIERARAAGVGPMITICDRMDHLNAVLNIAHSDEAIFASVGAHPHYATDHIALSCGDLVAAAAAEKRIVAIGETGLDQHYLHSPLDAQQRVFAAHIKAAQETGLPLIVHTRDSDALTGDMLEEAHAGGAFTPLMHCYTSGAELARRAIKLGGYLSFSGIVTFKNADDVRAIAKEAPLDRVILETDCPYLTPAPHRGRRCEPADVAHVYAAVAQLRGLSVDDLAGRVRDNVRRLFSSLPEAVL